MNQTLAYYNEHAEDFINQTQSVDMGLLYETFLSYIPQNGSILDAGCGSGGPSGGAAGPGHGRRGGHLKAKRKQLTPGTPVKGRKHRFLR